MTRGLNASFHAELQSDDPKPVILLEIETGDVGEPWIRITNQQQDVDFPASGGNTFEARPLRMTEVTIDGTERPAIEVELPDVDLAIDTWLDTVDFRFKKVNRYLVERDSLDSGAKAVLDVFRIGSRERGDRVAKFTAFPRAYMLSRIRLPRRTMTRELFPGLPIEGAIR